MKMFENQNNLQIERNSRKKSDSGKRLFERACEAAETAKKYLFKIQEKDGHWCAELESNATITAEYVYMRYAMGLDFDDRREKIIKYFLANQKSDGSWGIAYNLDGDVSTTAEVYLALRLLAIEETESCLKKAERFIVNQGGLEKVRIFTRINFAQFGLFPWTAVPVIPPEFILLPPESPVNIYNLSSWARGTMVPLFIIFHHKPIFALPNGKSENNNWLDHLWLNPENKNLPYCSPLSDVLKSEGIGWKSLFTASDFFLQAYEKILGKPLPLKKPLQSLREQAVKKCEQWTLEHQEKSGDWAGIFPPMVNGVMALWLNGHDLKSDPVRLGLEAIERFAIDDANGFRMQACESPVWDTVLSMIGVLDAGHPGSDQRLIDARNWVVSKQLCVDHGDWKIYNPNGTSGGWSFEYENSWYPDVDDTAAVVISFLKQDPEFKTSESVRRAVEWMVSMQNRDGGWAAFDLNNDKLFLNQIPFSDMDSLCDPSSPDVTGRVLEAFGILKDPKYLDVCKNAISYLRKSQESEGSWFGRWGVNYVYGTSNVLCSLKHHIQSGLIFEDDPMIVRAIDWLKKVQNHDGGWGECLESYSDKRLMGKGTSTASQTAWALMGLLAFVSPNDKSIQRGVTWLVENQVIDSDGTGYWREEEFTGTGFPNYFYLRYHLYRHYFPLMALGRFTKLKAC